MMYRATTPKHTFVFDVNPTDTFKTILITYSQDNIIILEKDKSSLTVVETTDCKGNTIYEASLRLTQEETNYFNANKTVSVQVRVFTYNNEALASEKFTVSVKDVLNDEVLS